MKLVKNEKSKVSSPLLDDCLGFGKNSSKSVNQLLAAGDYSYVMWLMLNCHKKQLAKAIEELVFYKLHDGFVDYVSKNSPEAKREQFKADYPKVFKFLEAESKENPDKWFAQVYRDVMLGRRPSEKCINICSARVEELENAAHMKYAGGVAERKEFNVVVESVKEIEVENRYGGYDAHNPRSYAYCPTIRMYINIMKDENGNKIVCKFRVPFGAVGEKVSFVATVKRNEVYQGVKQTVVNRPKFKQLAVAA